MLAYTGEPFQRDPGGVLLFAGILRMLLQAEARVTARVRVKKKRGVKMATKKNATDFEEEKMAACY